MEDSFKRINKETGKPFKAGFKDDSGRIFLRYQTSMVMTVIILKNGKKIWKAF